MSMLQTKAQEVGTFAAIPPGLWDAIIAIINELISMLKDKCNKTASEAVHQFHEPTVFNRLQVRRICVKHMGRKELRSHQGRVEDGVFEIAKKTTVDQMQAMYNEV